MLTVLSNVGEASAIVFVGLGAVLGRLWNWDLEFELALRLLLPD